MPGSGWPRAWPRLPSWIRSEALHEWIRSGGILIAAAWGVYTFVWKDILVPSWQPAHLNLDASLTPVAGRPASPEGQEMTLEVNGTNASSRRVYLLPNVWWISASHRAPRQVSQLQPLPPTTRRQQTETAVPRAISFFNIPLAAPSPKASDQRQRSQARIEADFVNDAKEVLRDTGPRQAERGVVSEPGGLLAIGRLFGDDFLDPGASLRRTILVRLPPGTTVVDLRVILPLLTRRPDGLFGGRRLAWGVADAMDSPMLLLCSAANGDTTTQPSECQPAVDGIDAALKRFDPQNSTITLQLQIGLPGGLGPKP
jgi:hypothetical protein